MSVTIGALTGVVVAWLMTVPLFRFKEQRPMTPRDVTNEAGVPIRAVIRHARYPGCTADQNLLDVIPVICWIRGCPGCGHRVPPSLVMLQLGLPAAMAVTASVFDSPWVIVPYLWFCVVVAAVSMVDARIWLIPWWFPWVGAAIGLALMTAGSLALDATGQLVSALGTGAGAFALFFVLWFAAPGRLGFGDVRLAFMIGLFLGWLDPLLAIWGFLLGSLVGIVVGLWTLAVRRGAHFAFGPALTLGALVALWFHQSLLGP